MFILLFSFSSSFFPTSVLLVCFFILFLPSFPFSFFALCYTAFLPSSSVLSFYPFSLSFPLFSYFINIFLSFFFILVAWLYHNSTAKTNGYKFSVLQTDRILTSWQMGLPRLPQEREISMPAWSFTTKREKSQKIVFHLLFWSTQYVERPHSPNLFFKSGETVMYSCCFKVHNLSKDHIHQTLF